ncbi:MAG: hypothetical protein AMK70_06080, partial [Nitrospira bacterium SG8_35_1]
KSRGRNTKLIQIFFIYVKLKVQNVRRKAKIATIDMLSQILYDKTIDVGKLYKLCIKTSFLTHCVT